MQNNQPDRTDRLAQMQPSDIREIHNLAQRIIAEDPSRRLIPLHFGESDMGTPGFIIEAACKALHDGAVFYENNSGRPDLKEVLVRFYDRQYGLSLTPDHFVISCGGTQAILLTMLALVAPGDRVINITPNWPNFTEAARIAGAEVDEMSLRFDEAQSMFVLDFDRIERAITSTAAVRMLIVNSPSNPTGWVITPEEQRRLYELCRSHEIYLVFDEIYDRIVYTEQPFPTALGLEDSQDGLVIINGFSKTYCMTGWRLGYLITNPSRARQMGQMQEFVVSHAPSMAQVAAITALEEGELFVQRSVRRYRVLRDMVVSRLTELPGAVVARTDGSFYCFFRVAGAERSVPFCKRLLTETGVVLAPGSAFGAGGEGWLRLCFANESALLQEALDQLEHFVQSVL